MKYLRKFENIDNQLYYGISYNEFLDYSVCNVYFPRKSVEEIAPRLKDKFYISYSSSTYIKINNTDVSSYDFECVIYQCDDEYFNIEYNSEGLYLFYRCDEMDGLLQFLKDENIIN